MAAELQLSLAKNISMIAEDLETMTPRELYERVLTGTENVLKETFRKMEKKQTKTENWCGYIQGVATRAARAGTEAPNNDGVIQHNNENHNPRRRGKNHIYRRKQARKPLEPRRLLHKETTNPGGEQKPSLTAHDAARQTLSESCKCS